MVKQNSQAEFVKCVIVGDPGVGKTCLICAWATGVKYCLNELVKTHVATVWAIDHYRTDREILERSWIDVDGACVSLRLWDTFGYHDKDRRFAYGRADVVILCFSVVKPLSLINVKKVWLPEIRKYCPTTPIVLVGTQADMRYLYNTEVYRNLEKGLLYRPIEEKDIISPQEGRDIAAEIGVAYYEASILTEFGIEDVFLNTVRAALSDRRKMKFWDSQLRKLKPPMIQPPMELPQPTYPKVTLPSIAIYNDLCYLLRDEIEGDVVFVAKRQCIYAHKICLMVTSSVFKALFLTDLKSPTLEQPAQEVVSEDKVSDDSDKDRLIDSDGVLPESPLSDHLNVVANEQKEFETKTFVPSHPAFHSVEIKPPKHPFQSNQCTVQLNPDITPQAFHYILEYLYTGVAKEQFDIFDQVIVAAELLQLPELVLSIRNFLSQEAYLNLELRRRFHIAQCSNLRELALKREIATDVTFQVDDGMVRAHKPLLMAHCEMMYAMFSDNFRESSAKVISFPGICKDTFKALQEYLYTGESPCMSGVDCMSLIEVANRLCLPRLVAFTEGHVVQELGRQEDANVNIMEDVLSILETAQLHNAVQLAKWCLHYLCVHFLDIFPQYVKLYKTLSLENQLYIDKHRWPPEWYVKEMELFQSLMNSPSKKQQHQKQQQFSRWERCTSSCLCFSRRHSHSSMADPLELPNS
ncbi:rho-related BTB domain-containing protein 2 [Octopus bimaculoides]|uniref:BTB domain-containing protein n=1 Tax=Octopus bimaculoides TaxID=37653 RepID=A0A0L8H7R4_OCTBM|nr:rho-related BTB domain-containing protein 2 [Octopus bimaculoides]XP_014774746.1 rho-related BTB domain-containing protein 2 [Octopus bimaculoides]XP_014774747.1 rho-related BTB domain-containing protein 2 [Octopus bimaculoides]XP_014774748.1 rho-related BTB domain-containing protein 2 [Octopus bimaculoides]|eukprot:XP_014774745.1 PREDICTED: rho-related BTB domain-containing protein 2-like [Octopus bimaculoides]